MKNFLEYNAGGWDTIYIIDSWKAENMSLEIYDQEGQGKILVLFL